MIPIVKCEYLINKVLPLSVYLLVSTMMPIVKCEYTYNDTYSKV